MGRFVFPAISVLVVTLLCVLPWGLPGSLTHTLPFLVLPALYYWTVREDAVLFPVVPFLSGLLADVTLAAPLGYWALLFLLGQVFSYAAIPYIAGIAPWRIWVGFAFVVAGVALAAWAVASLYVFQWLDWRPIVSAAILSLAVFPIMAALLGAGFRMVSAEGSGYRRGRRR